MGADGAASCAAEAATTVVTAAVTTAAGVIPVLSCYYPRYARAAESSSGRELVSLQVDLAPCVNDIIKHRPDLEQRFNNELNIYYRQQYAACGGHFLLCAIVCTEVAKDQTSPDAVRDAVNRQVDKLMDQLAACGPGFVTMVAQAVSGMTFKELQDRHGDAAAPLDPFFQSENSASNLPLNAALSEHVWKKVYRDRSPVHAAFDRWKTAGHDAMQQTSNEGMRKVFEAVVAHGLALRWAAFLEPSPLIDVKLFPPGFCAAGKGAYLDAADKLCWIELCQVAVCEACALVAGTTFPPPGGLTRNEYTLATDTNNPVVEGGGCVSVSSLPDPFERVNHMYFTVQMKRTVTQASKEFSAYRTGLNRLVTALPQNAPCIHLFWTVRPYNPEPSTLVALLTELRSSRSRGAADPPLDIVACVNVQHCLTPSLAWTLTCAGTFEA
jgi:hypothetical protein